MQFTPQREQSSKMWIILNTLSVTFSKDLKWNTLVSNVRTKQTEHLVFKDITYCHVPKMLRKWHKTGWNDQSWSMLALFGIHIVQEELETFRIVQLGLCLVTTTLKLEV